MEKWIRKLSGAMNRARSRKSFLENTPVHKYHQPYHRLFELVIMWDELQQARQHAAMIAMGLAMEDGEYLKWKY